MRRPAFVGLSLTAYMLAGGCARTAECGALDDCAAAEGTGTGTEGDDGSDGGEEPPPLGVNKDVDILFVIDNSGSMGEEQATLAANVGAFINVLETVGVEANYRIGVTTTDNGNPWCPAGTTTPEGGKLVMSSCKTRLDDFVFGNSIDVQDLACNDICTLSAEELEILPTTTDVDQNPAPRPWLENIEGKKNIPASTSTADAFACFGPQGINGCGFESPLESMYLALARSLTSGEASYGFMRANALLAVIFVTDEADCSYNKDYSVIFEEGGNKVFWSDPDASFPTSAVCWNAGVDCFGDPSAYDTCDPVNKNEFGASGVSDADAVLHPISRYIDLLQGLEDEKQQLDPNQEVIVGLIGGVNEDGYPVYADVGDSDPEFQASYGIGPGCTASNPLDPGNPISAVPPVRLRAVTDAFTPENMFSICAPDYSPVFAAIADRISDNIRPACFTQCVADTDPDTEILDAQCTVEQDLPGLGPAEPILECLRDANGYVIDGATKNYTMPNADVNVCYAMLVDKQGLTPDPSDDISLDCSESNFNLEFKIARRQGFPAPSGTAIAASCELAQFPDVECPGIGG